MNPIETLLDHKTIREFKPKPVPAELLQTLIDVSKRTASSQGLQAYSVIRITDSELKSAISKVASQEYIARMPELFIFIVDAYRNYCIGEEQHNATDVAYGGDTFFQGWTDACLAAQNLVAAAELNGLGTVFLGSILNDAPKTIELLGLPKYTFPVVGVGFGVPNVEPQLKPRIPTEYTLFENKYVAHEDYMELLKDYDAEMAEYYDTRNMNRKVDCFTKQVVTRFNNRRDVREQIGDQIRAQGFTI